MKINVTTHLFTAVKKIRIFPDISNSNSETI